MSMKNKLLMMAAMGLFLSSPNISFGDKFISDVTEDDIKNLKDKVNELRRKQLLKKGCKEFDFGDVTIIALNEKNALRKYNNYKKSLNNAK